jgi:hypothetical protein
MDNLGWVANEPEKCPKDEEQLGSREFNQIGTGGSLAHKNPTRHPAASETTDQSPHIP